MRVATRIPLAGSAFHYRATGSLLHRMGGGWKLLAVAALGTVLQQLQLARRRGTQLVFQVGVAERVHRAEYLGVAQINGIVARNVDRRNREQ